jgi:flagellar FliL protein
MSAAAESAAIETAARGGGGKKKLIVMALAALALLGGSGGGAAWWLGLLGGSSHAEGEAGAPEAEHGADTAEGHGADPHGAPAAGNAVAFVDLPDVVVNLQPSNGRMRFLKLRISLEVKGDREAEELRLLTPRILDSFQLYLRALTIDEVSGAVGMQRLKEELLARVHRAVEPARIQDVLIKEMLVQ